MHLGNNPHLSVMPVSLSKSECSTCSDSASSSLSDIYHVITRFINTLFRFFEYFITFHKVLLFLYYLTVLSLMNEVKHESNIDKRTFFILWHNFRNFRKSFEPPQKQEQNYGENYKCVLNSFRSQRVKLVT